MQTDHIPQPAQDIENQTENIQVTKEQSSYMDVTTDDVWERIKISFYPFSSQFTNKVGNNPDMFGPFWISATLAILLSIVRPIWTYNYSILTLPFMIVFTYFFSFGLPIIIGFLFRIIGAPEISFHFLVCLYGYAQIVLLPIFLLSFIPIKTLVIVGLIYGQISSMIFILCNLREEINKVDQQKQYMMIGFIVVGQLVQLGLLIPVII